MKKSMMDSYSGRKLQYSKKRLDHRRFPPVYFEKYLFEIT